MIANLETIEQLARDASPASVERLQDIERAATDRETRKAARRALYRMSQSGVAIGPASSRHNPATLAAVPPEDTLRAFVSACDGAGNQLLLYLVPGPDGGSPTLVQILTNDLEGVKEINTLKIRHREVKDRIERFSAQLDTGLAIAEVEPNYGRWLLAKSRSLNASLSRRSPKGVLEWLPKIGETQEEYSSPAFSRVTAAEIVDDAAIPHDPKELFALPWFEPWFFAAEDTMPWLPEWEQLTADAGENPSDDIQKRMQEIVADAANGLMANDMREIYIHRLEQTADVLWRRGKVAEAKQALWQSISLNTEAEAASIPFAREISFRTLGAALEMVRIHRERRSRG